jgi:hypothetical protein
MHRAVDVVVGKQGGKRKNIGKKVERGKAGFGLAAWEVHFEAGEVGHHHHFTTASRVSAVKRYVTLFFAQCFLRHITMVACYEGVSDKTI